MNIQKDGKTLYFSDEEISNETNGEKKVFVTKRINGKESHVKVNKKTEKTLQPDSFNFDNEIVIGVDKLEKKERDKKNNKKSNSSRKKRKKLISKKKVTVFISSILLIGVVIVFLLAAPVFNITKIEVDGNKSVSKENIINLSGLKKGENIFKLGSKVNEKIKENKYIEKVNVKRVFPNTVKIMVQEREIKYQINLINSYVYIDKNGYILENSSLKKEVPTIVGLKITENELINKRRLESEDLEKLGKINKIIESGKSINLDKIITEVNCSQNEYVLYLESKNKKIYIGDTVNLINKMLYIQKILEKEDGKTGTIFVNGDISSGFKPYFREE